MVRVVKRRTWILVAVAALVVAGAVGFAIGQAYFFPEKAQRVDEAAVPADAVLKRGSFQGADSLHRVSGTVKIVRAADGSHYLRFEEYQQTQGPDVFVYLTTASNPKSKGEVESGLRVLIDGGADGGESTKVGNFNQPLPVGFDPGRYQGVAIWCDRFDQLFGSASLA